MLIEGLGIYRPRYHLLKVAVYAKVLKCISKYCPNTAPSFTHISVTSFLLMLIISRENHVVLLFAPELSVDF